MYESRGFLYPILFPLQLVDHQFVVELSHSYRAPGEPAFLRVHGMSSRMTGCWEIVHFPWHYGGESLPVRAEMQQTFQMRRCSVTVGALIDFLQSRFWQQEDIAAALQGVGLAVEGFDMDLVGPIVEARRKAALPEGDVYYASFRGLWIVETDEQVRIIGSNHSQVMTLAQAGRNGSLAWNKLNMEYLV